MGDFKDLIKKHCIPCEGGTSPLGAEEIQEYTTQLEGKWEVLGNTKIKRKFKFKDFKETMVFVNKVAGIAEEEGHHPDMSINYNRATIELTTHAIGGLSENDFIVAAKIDTLMA